ncbi:tetraacyldisaccharide 4'-kinase [Bdellovibrionota bacterium FG-2]
MLNQVGSFLWSLATLVMRILVEWGLIKPYHLRVRVISVGNIQVGGSGKTPLVAQIANEAHARGLRVAILTRGYKGAWEKTGGVIFPEDLQPTGLPNESTVRPEICGDEPALLHELAPFAAIAIGADRVRSFMNLVHELRWAVDLVILDDGFQHFRIHRDLDVVALTSRTRSEILFRDFDSSVTHAGGAVFCVWTKGDEVPSVLDGWQPSMRVRLQISQDARRLMVEKKLWLVTGIADPQELKIQLQNLGVSLDRSIEERDHVAYEVLEVESILAEASAQGATVVLTGKDWVKWRGLGVSREQVIVLEPEVEFCEGRALWDRMLWGR